MRYALILSLFLTSCGHLDSYDIGLTAGQTEFTGDSDTKAATTANMRINWHFKTR